MIKKQIKRHSAKEVTKKIIKKLQGTGYDAFYPGGYHDVSKAVAAIIENVLSEHIIITRAKKKKGE